MFTLSIVKFFEITTDFNDEVLGAFDSIRKVIFTSLLGVFSCFPYQFSGLIENMLSQHNVRSLKLPRIQIMNHKESL